jgi:hypothetical protein
MPHCFIGDCSIEGGVIMFYNAQKSDLRVYLNRFECIVADELNLVNNAIIWIIQNKSIYP